MSSALQDIITVVRYDASMQELWDDFVSCCKNFTFLFSRAYIDYNPRLIDYSLLFYKGGKLLGVLPACIKDDVLLSHGGLTYGGFLVKKEAATADVEALFVALRRHLEKTTAVKKIIYSPVPHIYTAYPAEEELYMLFRCRAALAARRVSSVVWLREALPFSTLRRRKVKMALKAGFSIIADCGFAAFWAVLQENLQKSYATSPVHSLAEIELLSSRFPRNIKLYRVVDKDGATVAGTLLYVTDRVVRVQYIGSVEEGRKNGALDYLFDYLVHHEYAGKEYFDFGTSVEEGGRVLNKGLIFQKEGFGGRAVVYDTYEFEVKNISEF